MENAADEGLDDEQGGAAAPSVVCKGRIQDFEEVGELLEGQVRWAGNSRHPSESCLVLRDGGFDVIASHGDCLMQVMCCVALGGWPCKSVRDALVRVCGCVVIMLYSYP